MKLKHFAIMIIAGLILSGCSQTADLYFYADESWRYDTRIQYDAGLIDLFSQGISMAIGSEFGITLPAPGSSSAMDAMGILFNAVKTELRKQGIDFNWRRSGDTFLITARGDSLQKFNQFSSGMAGITALGDGQYRLEMDVVTLEELEPSLGEYRELTDALFAYSFTLHAGRIFSSDADEQTGSRAIWHNPGQITAVFTPAALFPWGIAIPVCGVGSLGAIPFFALAGRKKCPGCGKWGSKKREYCPHCGEAMRSSMLDENYF